MLNKNWSHANIIRRNLFKSTSLSHSHSLGVHSPSQADDTRSHEFLDLQPDVGVLHVLLQRGRVVLGLLEDALHDRVLEDGHDLHRHVSLNIYRQAKLIQETHLWIPLDSLRSLLLRLAGASVDLRL